MLITEKNLANILLARYMRTGIVSDLDECHSVAGAATDRWEKYVEDGLKPSHSEEDISKSAKRTKLDEVYIEVKYIFGRTKQFRYKFHNGSISDLDGAMKHAGESLQLARALPGFSKNLILAMASTIGLTMRARFKALGDVSSLDNGIDAIRLALEGRLLGNFFFCQFPRLEFLFIPP
jgi:hypothetical protein